MNLKRPNKGDFPKILVPAMNHSILFCIHLRFNINDEDPVQFQNEDFLLAKALTFPKAFYS